jgi:hypothetical protein
MYVTINLDGTITEAPATLTDEQGRVHYHPSDAMYESQGYFLQVDTPMPEQAEGDTTVYAGLYEAQGNQAVQVWQEVEPGPSVEPVPTLEEKVAAIEATVTNLEATIDTMLTGG